MTDKWREDQATVPWHVLRDEPGNPPPRVTVPRNRGIEGRTVTPTPRLPERAAWVRAAAAVLPAVVLGLAIWRGLALAQAPAAPIVAEPSPVVVERVVEVQVIVTATPPAAQVQVQPAPARGEPAQVAPRQAVPQAIHQAVPQAQPTPRRVQPTTAPPVQAQVQAQPTAAPGPQQRLLSRDCVYPSAPQGTIIRGYYTDAAGRPRDAVCRADGWKAVD